MQIAVVDVRSGLSRYIHALFRAWGLACLELVAVEEACSLNPAKHPVTIVPKADLDESQVGRFKSYAEAGGTVVAICPAEALAAAAGVQLDVAERTGSLRLRVHGLVVRGLQGESLPIVGPAQAGRAPDEAVMASMYVPNQSRGEECESPAIVSSRLGQGLVVGILFDLPRAVMLLRQGDPRLADRRLDSSHSARRGCKPTNIATDIGPSDAGHIPFADLLARVLVDLVLDACDQPMPLLSTFPYRAAGVLLMSGDEDDAALRDIDDQMQSTTDANGRMNLYIIPGQTQSSRADAQRYAQSHDLGPHPDIVAICDEPAEVRVAEYARQIEEFEEMFRRKARSVRNHVTGWVGYLDLVEVQERLRVQMDANYLSGSVFRERNHAPFSPFGGALPVRFVDPEGRLFDVYQQHTQVNDDIWFAPDRSYSYKFSEAVAESVTRRILTQLSERFRMPLTCNFHPGNWSFAKGHAIALMRFARDHNIVCWSLDRWLDFCLARDACEMKVIGWSRQALDFELTVSQPHDDLCIELPKYWDGLAFDAVTCDGQRIDWSTHEQLEGQNVRLPVRHQKKSSYYRACYRHARFS